MNQKENHTDQREFARICKEVVIEVSEIAYPLPQEPGERCVCKNISGGGICFTTTSPCKPKTLLSLKLHITGWQSYKKPFSRVLDISSEEPLTAIGEAVWCRRLADGSAYDVGIKFVNIYEDDYKALMKYLESQC